MASAATVPAGRTGAVSLVVPTRNEAGNVTELLARLERLPAGVLAEVIFVDDSDDDTPAVIHRVASESLLEVRVVHRGRGARSGGLSGAVVEGFRIATGDWVCVMDADLQHPPEVIARLLQAGTSEGVDLVCATRNVEGGERHGLSRVRDAISQGSTLTARLLFPRRLRGVSDPMSGFFMVRRDAVDLQALRPSGFKILLEILVRTPGLRRVEVAFEFGPRFAGESKASLREGGKYLHHLARLRLGLDPKRAAALVSACKFGAVGAAGIVVNQALMWSMVERGGLGYLLAAVLATQGSTTFNFFLTDRWVFRSSRRVSTARCYLGFSAMNNAALVLRVPLLALLVSGFGLHYLVGNLVTLVALFAVRFTLSDRLIWNRTGDGPGDAPLGAVHDVMPYRYDVGGVVTIASEVELRELGWFRTQRVDDPDIEICRGLVGRRLPQRQITVDVAEGDVLYQEHLGALATNFSVEMSGPIRITVSPLLAASPHVVYTNVVEALLRFVLVSRGWMLLHSATFVIGGRAVMLSAKTDTGKTGTILRILREREGIFLSDDMTIIGPDGSVHCYPKPLTISAHTLRAVNAAALSRRERIKLAVQSRIHSKSGRSLGSRLASLNLPIMALNAFTQMVIPPPKYMVNRLVPCAIGKSARVTDMFIIERGEPGLSEVGFEESLDELIANTDDAYGFPPFSQFAPAIALDGDGYLTLRARERAILASALQHIRVRRVVSNNFSWADTIPELLAADAAVYEHERAV